jgi:subtilase family serine protease
MRSKTIARFCFSSSAAKTLALGIAAITVFHGSLGQAQKLPNGKQEIVGHVNPAFEKTALVGKLDDEAIVHLAIGLPMKDRAGLEKQVADLYDPKSPNFHHFLSEDDFAKRYGASEQDYQALINFAKSHGLTVTATYADRLQLSVSGKVSAVNAALHISLTARRRADGSIYYAPDREPSVDLDTKILHIGGLDNLEPPKPKGGSGGSGPNGLLGGSDFRNAYAAGAPQTGAGQSVGLFELDGFYQSDIELYTKQFSEFSKHVPPIKIVALNKYVVTATESGPPYGGCNPTSPIPKSAPPAGTPGGHFNETALDIDMAMAMAPGLDSVIVYEGCTGDDILKAMAHPVNGVLPKQLSASWSIPTDSNAEQTYWQMAASGQSFLWAAGDDNTTCPVPICPGSNCGQNVRPTMPDVTSVGGTILQMSNNGGAWQSETAAHDGGGLLVGYAMPDYQKGVPTKVSNPKHWRMNPDVSMESGDGSPNGVWVGNKPGYVIFSFGTSVAAPLWAGYTALINQKREEIGVGPIGWLNPALYAIGSNAKLYARDFHDIDSGTSPAAPASQCQNGVTTSNTAAAGYDLVTGLGTPTGNLIADLGGWPSYRLFCHGPLKTTGDKTPFVWAHAGAGASPPPAGHCAWADRGPRGAEIKQGDSNVILGQLGGLANLPAGKYAWFAVYTAPKSDNDLVVTETGKFVNPPFSSDPFQLP